MFNNEYVSERKLTIENLKNKYFVNWINNKTIVIVVIDSGKDINYIRITDGYSVNNCKCGMLFQQLMLRILYKTACCT